ncbi:outer membrane beta-barrel protein [Microbulbifer agarilyticus]
MLSNTRSLATCILATALSAYCVATFADPIKLGSGLLLTPAVGLDLRYDDNINNAPEDGIDSFLLLTTPRVGLEYDRGAIVYSMEYALSHGNYLNSGRSSFTDHALSGTADWDLGRRHNLTFGAAYLSINDEFNDQVVDDLESLIFERDRYRQSDLFVSYGFGAEGARGFLGVTLGTSNRDYREEIVARDRRSPFISGTFSANIGGNTALLAILEGRRIRYDTPAADVLDRDNDEGSLMVGIERETEKITATLLGGMVKKSYTDPEISDYRRPRWQAALTWSPLEISELILTAERRPIDSAAGIANFVDATSGSVAWRHSWNEKFESDLFFRYTKADFTGTELTESIRRWGTTLRYQFRPWMDLRTGISTLNQGATSQLFSYQRNQVFIGFDASY